MNVNIILRKSSHKLTNRQMLWQILNFFLYSDGFFKNPCFSCFNKCFLTYFREIWKISNIVYSHDFTHNFLHFPKQRHLYTHRNSNLPQLKKKPAVHLKSWIAWYLKNSNERRAPKLHSLGWHKIYYITIDLIPW